MRALLAVAVAVALLAAVAVLALGGGPAPEACGVPAYVDGADAAPSAAPDGGLLRVVEQGFTQTGDAVSVGAVLENTSAHPAYRTRVQVRLFDAKRVWLPEVRFGEVRRVVEIPVVLPGQRIGFGADAHPAPLYGGGKALVASFEVELLTTTWLGPGALGSFGRIVADSVRTERPNPAATSIVGLTYRERSPNCSPLAARGAAAVFRDAAGQVVGGAIEPAGALVVFRDPGGAIVGGHAEPPASPPCSPGERELWVIPLNPAPDTADPARTEVYPYCDLSRPVPGTGAREPRN